MKTRRFGMWLGVLCLVSVLIAGSAGACTEETPAPTTTPTTTAPAEAPEPVTLRLAIQAFPTEPAMLATDDFAKRFNERAGGKAEIAVYGGGSLGLSTQYLDMVRTGAVDLAVFPTGHVEEYAPVFTAPSLPFLFNNAVACAAALEPMAEAVFNGILEGQFNQKPVGWAITSTPNLGSAKKSVKTLEDMEGLLVAAVSPSQFTQLKALGATPVNVAGPELYGSFEKGVVDAVLMPVDGAIAMKLYEVMQHWTVCEVQIGMACMSHNLEAFNKLPQDLQTILFEEGGKWGDDLSQKRADAEIAMTEQLKQAGVEVYELPSTERERWAQACQSIWDEYIANVGPDGERLIAIADEANKANP